MPTMMFRGKDPRPGRFSGFFFGGGGVHLMFKIGFYYVALAI